MHKMQFSESIHVKFTPLVYEAHMDHVNRFSSPFVAIRAGFSALQLNPSADGLFRIFATSSQVRLGFTLLCCFEFCLHSIQVW